MSQERNCYVYEILVDGVVRYIGKGTGRRIRRHVGIAKRIAERRAAGETFWARMLYNKLAKALASGANVETRYVVQGLTDTEAFARESLEIANNPVENLWNSRNGGPGNSSDYSRSLWRDPSYREKQSAAREANREAAIESLKRARSIRWSDPEQRRSQSEAGKVRAVHLHEYWISNPEKRSETAAEMWADPGYRQNVTAGQRRRWEREEARTAMSDAMSKVWSDENRRAKMSKTISGVWSDPAYRENQVAKQRERFKDPAYRAAHGAKIRAGHAKRKARLCST